MLQTEYEFTLPRGFVDAEGNVHRQGTMRLATAMDEITPMRDPRVTANEAYLAVLLLSRVVTRLGTLSHVSPEVIGGLFSSDFAYLQDLYRHINEDGHTREEVVCPKCQHHFEREVFPLGG